MEKKLLGLCLCVLLVGCQSPADPNRDKGDNGKVGTETLNVENTFVERKEITQQITNKDLKKVNMYLSDLSNSGFQHYNKEAVDNDALLNLGYWLFVYDGMDKVTNEEVEGISYNVYDYDDFNDKLNRYFDFEIDKKGNSEWKFQNNKFYYPSIDTGYDINKVTQVERVFDNGDNSFLIEASIYKFESSMEYDAFEQYVQPKSTWTATMESELIATITTTVVYSEKLDRYVLGEYQTEYLSSQQHLNEDEYVDTSGVKADCFDCTVRELDYYLETGEYLVVNDYRTLSEEEYNKAYKTDIFNYENKPVITAGVVEDIIFHDDDSNVYTAILNIDPFSDDYPYTISLLINKVFPQLLVGDAVEVYVVPQISNIEGSEGFLWSELEYFRFLDDHELRWILE